MSLLELAYNIDLQSPILRWVYLPRFWFIRNLILVVLMSLLIHYWGTVCPSTPPTKLEHSPPEVRIHQFNYQQRASAVPKELNWVEEKTWESSQTHLGRWGSKDCGTSWSILSSIQWIENSRWLDLIVAGAMDKHVNRGWVDSSTTWGEAWRWLRCLADTAIVKPMIDRCCCSEIQIDIFLDFEIG